MKEEYYLLVFFFGFVAGFSLSIYLCYKLHKWNNARAVRSQDKKQE